MSSKAGWVRGVVVGLGSLALVSGAWVVPAVGVTVTVESSNGVPGGIVTLKMRLLREAGDPQIVTLQSDIRFPVSQLSFEGMCVDTEIVCANDFRCCQGYPGCTPESVANSKGACTDLDCMPDLDLLPGQFAVSVPIVDDDPAPMGGLMRLSFPPVVNPTPFPIPILPSSPSAGQTVNRTFMSGVAITVE